MIPPPPGFEAQTQPTPPQPAPDIGPVTPPHSTSSDGIPPRKTSPSEDSTMLLPEEMRLIVRKTLHPQHQTDPNVLRFINAYLDCRDAKQAARSVGLHAMDGVNLRKRPDIYECIRQLTEAAVMKYGYDAAEVVEKVKEIAFIDMAEFQNPDGSFKERLSDIAPESRRAIKKMKVKNIYDSDPNGMKVVIGSIIEIEVWDKMKAVELLGREKDIFKETKKIEHGITENMAATLLESKERAEQRKMMEARKVHQLPDPVERAAMVLEVSGE